LSRRGRIRRDGQAEPVPQGRLVRKRGSAGKTYFTRQHSLSLFVRSLMEMDEHGLFVFNDHL
jgi:hypothetical protein